MSVTPSGLKLPDGRQNVHLEWQLLTIKRSDVDPVPRKFILQQHGEEVPVDYVWRASARALLPGSPVPIFVDLWEIPVSSPAGNNKTRRKDHVLPAV